MATRPNVERIDDEWTGYDNKCSRDLEALVTYIWELENWANRMPDAGITVDDPRLRWWYERPCAPSSTFTNNKPSIESKSRYLEDNDSSNS